CCGQCRRVWTGSPGPSDTRRPNSELRWTCWFFARRARMVRRSIILAREHEPELDRGEGDAENQKHEHGPRARAEEFGVFVFRFGRHWSAQIVHSYRQTSLTQAAHNEWLDSVPLPARKTAADAGHVNRSVQFFGFFRNEPEALRQCLVPDRRN